MTPQDKNFITRIQLQQLMAASGNADDKDPAAALAEDFYYQVYSQIRSGPRQNPHQPLNHFAQTYLFQTGNRHGTSRRHNRGENHMQRMEQQVQRAVEAAKQRPKNTQLVIEGSLGKIAYSNTKAPRAILNIKRPESGDQSNKHHGATRSISSRNQQSETSTSDAKTTLLNLETVYTTLMRIEEHLRQEPPPPNPGTDPSSVDSHMEWSRSMKSLTDKLWQDLKVLEPVDPESPSTHPFIAMLAHPKGKKAIPRVFRFLSATQRLTTLTIIFLHLDLLDVVRLGQYPPGATQLPVRAREAIDLFSGAVLPALFAFVSEAPLFNVIGLLGLVLDRVNVQQISRTRVGLSVLTMLTSRATLIRDAPGGVADEAEWQQWTHSYEKLFDTLEPVLPSIFPMPINSGEDTYIWQFLASMGSGASPDQQSRLVIAVK